MSFTLETKLHILLIMTVAGIALYMYLLYKEVKVFQDEIVVIKQQIYAIQTSGSQLCKKADSVATPVVPFDVPKSVVVVDDNDDEDVASVTSIEIKDILTNIHEEDELDIVSPQEVEATTAVSEVVLVPAPGVDLVTLSEAELNTVSYIVLRDYLKLHKISYKGTKADFVKRIVELLPKNIL